MASKPDYLSCDKYLPLNTVCYLSKRIFTHESSWYPYYEKVKQLLRIEQRERDTIEVGKKETSINKKKLPPEWAMGNK